jgi:hypothetical protein
MQLGEGPMWNKLVYCRFMEKKWLFLVANDRG